MGGRKASPFFFQEHHDFIPFDRISFVKIMKKGAVLTLALYLSSIPVSFSQEFRLPRNPEKLIDRALTFWALITSNQRFRALEFVLPEKRDVFLAGRAMPI